MRAVKQPLLCRAPHAARSTLACHFIIAHAYTLSRAAAWAARRPRLSRHQHPRLTRRGYHGKYEWFGKPSARLDDLTNLAPARLTALALTAAALVTPECDAARGIRAAWRDCSLCASPNAGWPMGAMAGLLGVRLEKEGHYALGEAIRPLGPRSIYTGHRIAQLAGGLVTLAAVATCTYLH